MRNSTYYYNAETCQYEPASLRAMDVFLYCLGVVFVGALVFVGATIAYDALTESDSERALRRENKALSQHQEVINKELTAMESSLTDLKKKDQEIYTKLFDDTGKPSGTPTNQTAILMAGAADFEEALDGISAQSSSLNKQSREFNDAFENSVTISRKDLNVIQSIPTLQPIANPNLDLLVSGFGVRINPFHKGKYKHQGIDFAATRGTEIFATANGRVIDVNRSDLQAGSGNSIEIDHGHGFVTRYSHLENILVKTGMKVTKGTIIGTVGNSGGSIAPHLHYEVIHKGDNVDPMTYMIEGLDSHAYNKLNALSRKQNQSLD